jgi:glucose-6-phosphate isomerase
VSFSVSIADTGASVDVISGMLDAIYALDRPDFAKYEPDLGILMDAAKASGDIEHLIVIGNGGSVTTLKGLRWLAPAWEGRLHIIDTLDPSYLLRVKEAIGGKRAHVLAISKSGRNMNALESLTLFKGIPTTLVTARTRSPLAQLAKANRWSIVEVPDNIAGRFSGRTASALLPAAILGIDIKSVSDGIGAAYKNAAEEKALLDLSGAIYLKERVGLRTLFIPVYSRTFAGFNDLVTQMMHETLSKDRKGLTALCFEGPEVQHHTNQRILDGPEDVVSLFVTREGNEGPKISWDGPEGDVMLGEKYLNEVGGYTLGKAFRSEYEGVMGHMRELKMPFANLLMKGEGPFELGEYVGIWHYLAYYFALLRKVNPFDQPAVEKAKEIGMALRLR